jgi:hypothetical protein
MFDTRKTYDAPQDRGGIVALSFAPGNGKQKVCAGVPVYKNTQMKQKRREKYFINL